MVGDEAWYARARSTNKSVICSKATPLRSPGCAQSSSMMATTFKLPSVEAGTGGHTRGGIPGSILVGSQPCTGVTPENGPSR